MLHIIIVVGSSSFLKMEDQWWRHEGSPCFSIFSQCDAFWNW